MAAAIFTKMAELGLMGAKAIRPTKLKKGLRFVGDKVIKKDQILANIQKCQDLKIKD